MTYCKRTRFMMCTCYATTAEFYPKSINIYLPFISTIMISPEFKKRKKRKILKR